MRKQYEEGYQSFSLEEWLDTEFPDDFDLDSIEAHVSSFFKHINSEIVRLNADRDQVKVYVHNDRYDSGGVDIQISFNYPYTKETLTEAVRLELEACDKNQQEYEENHRKRMAYFDRVRADCEQKLKEWGNE